MALRNRKEVTSTVRSITRKGENMNDINVDAPVEVEPVDDPDEEPTPDDFTDGEDNEESEEVVPPDVDA